MVTSAAFGAQADIVWHDGKPTELSPDNPYLPALNAHVVRAQRQLAAGQAEHPFYLVWGAAGPGSVHRENAKLRELAISEFDKATREREKKPQGFWAIYGDLEALLLWQLEGKIPAKQIATWQKRLRPSIDLNISVINDKKSWIYYAANTRLQSAAILQLAVTVYGKTRPRDPALKRWAAQARRNVAKAREIQLEGGAFSYIRQSGPDPVYFAFDTAHLGRYYQLTGDADARDSLVRMAEWARAATRCGWLTPFSSPWWKHVVGPGGPYTGPETVTALSDDSAMRALMHVRRGYIQPYVWSYVNMYSYVPAEGDVGAIADRCEFDRNANGPALRAGGFDVGCPARPWGDSLFGACFAGEKSITSCVNAVYLAANMSNKQPRERTLRLAYGMLAAPAVKTHGTVVGDGWIAAANSVDAHVGRYGDVPPDTSPWRRTDVWFASADGAAGSLSLECASADTVRGIELWVVTNDKKTRAGDSRVALADFTVHLEGNLGKGRTAAGPQSVTWFPVDATGEREYKPGERFAARVRLQRPGKPALTAGEIMTDGNLRIVEIKKSRVHLLSLVYNASADEARHKTPSAGTVWGREKRAAKAGEEIPVGPWELLVVAPEPAVD